MKTRLKYVQYQTFFFNPYNGFDVDVPDELIARHMRALQQLDAVQVELAALLTPRAAEVDAQVNEFYERKGLRYIVGDTEG